MCRCVIVVFVYQTSIIVEIYVYINVIFRKDDEHGTFDEAFPETRLPSLSRSRARHYDVYQWY